MLSSVWKIRFDGQLHPISYEGLEWSPQQLVNCRGAENILSEELNPMISGLERVSKSPIIESFIQMP